MVIVQSSLRCLDGEAAHAFGYRGSYDEDGIHSALSPVAATIQAHARGYVVRRRLYENQEQARCRWIEYHLSARNTAAARALGWLPRRIADARKGSPPESAKLLLRDDERRAANGGSSPPKPDPAGAVHRSAALDFPRFLAAVHVAAYHGWTATSTPRAQLPNILLWGYTWVPFFFLLSGFVLFFSKAQAEGSSVQKAREFGFTGKGKAWLWLWKRWVAVYPLFLLSLVLGMWGVPLFAHPHGQWMELLNMLLMLQAWAVELRCTDTTTLCAYVVWNEPAWFVSALFWCWLTFPFAYRQLHRMGFNSVCLCGGLLYASTSCTAPCSHSPLSSRCVKGGCPMSNTASRPSFQSSCSSRSSATLASNAPRPHSTASLPRGSVAASVRVCSPTTRRNAGRAEPGSCPTALYPSLISCTRSWLYRCSPHSTLTSHTHTEKGSWLCLWCAHRREIMSREIYDNVAACTLF